MRVAIDHPELGLFLGLVGKKLYWTETPCHGVIIMQAVTFEDADQATMFCLANLSTQLCQEIKFKEVDTPGAYADIPSLIAAGLGHRCSRLLYFTPPVGCA